MLCGTVSSRHLKITVATIMYTQSTAPNPSKMRKLNSKTRISTRQTKRQNLSPKSNALHDNYIKTGRWMTKLKRNATLQAAQHRLHLRQLKRTNLPKTILHAWSPPTSINAPQENKYHLNQLLKPLIEKSPYICKNSTEFVKNISEIRLPPGSKMISYTYFFL